MFNHTYPVPHVSLIPSTSYDGPQGRVSLRGTVPEPSASACGQLQTQVQVQLTPSRQVLCCEGGALCPDLTVHRLISTRVSSRWILEGNR